MVERRVRPSSTVPSLAWQILATSSRHIVDILVSRIAQVNGDTKLELFE